MACSLYDLTIFTVSDYFSLFKRDLHDLPDPILFDICMRLYHQGSLCVLSFEFCDLDVFSRILKVTEKRVLLLKCFQDVIKHGTRAARDLTISYEMRCLEIMNQKNKDSLINLGLRLGPFLSESGWIEESSRVLKACLDLCLMLPETVETWNTILECCHKLLHVSAKNFNIPLSNDTKLLAKQIIGKLDDAGCYVNCAGIYSEFSHCSFAMGKYTESYELSRRAVFELTPETPPGIVIHTLSQASKACVVKREFSKASALVKQAVELARETYGENHPKYADTLIDYGFVLLSSDSTRDSVIVYETALKVKQSVFGERNLHVAVAHEELAYALYVQEYSTGSFNSASKHVEEAIKVYEKLLPSDHMLLASAQRVKALILEEVALDFHPSDASSDMQNHMLMQAEKFHIKNLKLAQQAFGEDNILTAKHYGNIGRLYQSMKRYKESEAMHLKAIEIKERICGIDDFEVGLSVGHLASLYNFHMKEYIKAEALYYKSISINMKLYSESYSGLQYDYRGLIHVYNRLGNADKKAVFLTAMNRWKDLREREAMMETEPLASPPQLTIRQLQELYL